MREAIKEGMIGLAVVLVGLALVLWVPVAGMAFAECGTEMWVDRLSHLPVCPSESDIHD